MSAIVGDWPLSRSKWMDNYIAPGAVNSVGDVNLQVKLKHSCPDLPLRFSETFSHGNLVRDGSREIHAPLGTSIRDKRWTGRYKRKIAHGWLFQNLRPEDCLAETTVAGIPQYSWLNKIATVEGAKVTGEKFLPVPGPYRAGPDAVPRGGSVIRTVAIENEERNETSFFGRVGSANPTDNRIFGHAFRKRIQGERRGLGKK